MRGFHKTELTIFCPPPPFLMAKKTIKKAKNDQIGQKYRL